MYSLATGSYYTITVVNK